MMKRIVISLKKKNGKGTGFQGGVRKVVLLIWMWQTIFVKKTKVN